MPWLLLIALNEVVFRRPLPSFTSFLTPSIVSIWNHKPHQDSHPFIARAPSKIALRFIVTYYFEAFTLKTHPEYQHRIVLYIRVKGRMQPLLQQNTTVLSCTGKIQFSSVNPAHKKRAFPW